MKHRQVIGVLVGVAVAVIVVALLGKVFAIRTTQQTNTKKTDTTVQTLAAVEALAKKINSCVDPTGACAQRGQRNQANAINSINHVVILAAACSVGIPPHESVAAREVAIQNCVIARLAADQRH